MDIKNTNVYVKINSDGFITEINSDSFISDTSKWTKIDEGKGDVFVHAQRNYFKKPICDEYGRYNNKLVDGEIAEITQEEKDIMFLSSTIAAKKTEVSAECEKAITAGVDVGNSHYSMTVEDQANILAWMPLAQAGQSVPYHADGQPCRVFTAEEFMAVANAAVAYKTHHTTYCNLLMRQIEGMTDPNEIKAVKYGVTQLEGEYAEQYNVIMASLVGGSDETS